MIKKLFYAIAAGAMLFAVSCQNDDLAGAQGDAVTVSVAVSTPEIATRAYSDGQTATELQWAVYDKNGNFLPNISSTSEIHGSTTVELTLTTGNTYDVIFWAASPEATSAKGGPYTTNFDTKYEQATMTVDYEGVVSNDENLDAFYAVKRIEVKSKQQETVELKRPFAQINVGTADYQASEDAGYVPVESKVVVKSISNVLTFANGAVNEPSEVTFDFAAIDRTQKFPVAGAYEYLAMNYVLVGKDKTTTDVTFSYKDAEENYTHTRTIGAVPVQRNYRTNIFGNILTSEVDINVTINPEYEDEYANDVFYAFTYGGEVTLTQDHVINHTLVVKAGADAVLNLNGYSIKNYLNENPLGTDVIVVEEGASLTINGEGTIEAVSGNDGYAIISKGTVIINGGTYKAGVDENGEANAVVYARDNGKVYVNGGYFPNENNSTFVLNKRDANRQTTVIEVKGGKFVGFDPMNNAAENAGTNFCAEGYISIEKDNCYEVVSGAIVTNGDEFKAAANANLKYIIFANDIDCGTAFVEFKNHDVVINGNGYSLTAGGKTTKNYGLGFYGCTAEVNNLKMIGGGGIYTSQGAYVTVNDVTLKIKYSASGRNMFYVNGATLVVNSGEFEVLNTGYYVFSMQNNGVAYVNGGTFADMLDKRAPVYTDTGATLYIMGGKFQVNVPSYKFDPTPYLATGYKAERVGNYMEVSAE